MAITLPIASIKKALIDTVALIAQVGISITYKFHDNTPQINIRAVKQKLKEAEIVGTYRETDVRFVIDATTLPKKPEKFDTIIHGSEQFVVIDALAVEKSLDDTILVYSPIARGN